jgi:hypothetical protein
MQIDRRLTNGLAWAGALIVVAIPTADLVSSHLMGDGANARPAQIALAEAAPAVEIAPIPAPLSQRPVAPAAQTAAVVATPVATPAVAPTQTTAPVQVAVAAPAKPVAAKPAATDSAVVSAYINSGKALPSYITDASTPAQASVPVKPAQPSQPATVAVAAPTAAPVAPVVSEPVVADPVVVGSVEPRQLAPVPMPLSMRPHPVVVARPAAVVVPPDTITPSDLTAADLRDWESGPLSEFLAKRQARAQGTPAPEYDADGFFLDQGPNGGRDRLIGPAEPLGFWGGQ